MPTNNKLILGITGNMAAGKSTITEYIKEHHGGVSFRYSTMLRDVLSRIHVEETRDNLQQLSTFLRSTYGEDLMSKVIAEDVKNATDTIIIVEGIRRPSDVTYIKEIPGFHLIAVTADIKKRFERITQRSENPDDQTKTFETFEKEQAQETEGKIDEISQDAEVIIDNNGNLEALYTQIDNVVSKYSSSK
ncbi:MAG: hypothetical protein UV82_C0006G0002 [Candidatus Magasanikbacteria bacterium GW2011_GWD2_43_18]|uniref:Dephospho-CoA kinase n=1 Tax=Candidatus Magasanikbacteria bacterium GW2011_GWE2_42_7 TaxID=1619052 RepID=A0A0G1BHZ9_9BACT|nr:MAG: hypothetical protein UV18_C0005G0086 [Candidatus Magasanikbacteria bacterium GW2011_GWC2_42_27]KKS72819.1 MAG: hypothetical protein UV42_C0004G0031 [Candidatus Magasanikbacteria bacterium GW2011_GWE2_42_7]KKT04646.1 MAG: hypothetical protein UV82_C0006G0002 [Candidatus Magasanikbacteria bacterium GW2011_GWD2_43_18]KKT24937.1 MAG: hypothetical protein UW10_C0017G0016 [Candidatus Magasanikbacteria bacterium GW2011_GWA2_43_9]HBB37952.1 hypothetical protein [Candidatus Magasanikbacteria bac